MNHKDKKECFKREITLFDNVISKLAQLHKNGGVLVDSNALSEVEGGYYELKSKEIKLNSHKP
jgi:hypothetical protein